MALQWISESPAYWDQDKARIVGGAPAGIFDVRYQRCQPGDLLPASWWRVSSDGETVGYGWLDIVWGDAEILLATAPGAQGKGVGSFILDKLEEEALARGVNYLYNVVRPTHPQRDAIAAWLSARGFEESDDGSLFRAISRKPEKS
ncbi:GNAT family N-acetyltransferase [Haliangium ochraceum]|uniref:GCN5-related N-acetyltransferase n=1 Tax=Haliangium ochraceum (strain DSM 14365 / JCM 11303 / SMP-2) TaxID=502025 RepID=D0LIT3_HALO1|nr:GNAT family N-acetyltransferase [Haliangium ochraceum]ACY12962.1 GCN5-related N-acetyltransferase [Haliangium ochraceum DSM 14365]